MMARGKKRPLALFHIPWNRMAIPLTAGGLLGATVLDQVAGPILLRGRVDLHFTAAAVILTGMYTGSLRGLLAGWLGGLILASSSGEFVGLSMLSLGVAGFFAGRSKNLTSLELPPVDTLVLIGLLLVEDVAANLSAVVAGGAGFRINVLGILTTVAAMGWILWRFPPGGEKKLDETESQTLKSETAVKRPRRRGSRREGGMFS